MAWSQAHGDPSTAGFGNEAGLGQSSVVQTRPFPVVHPGKGSWHPLWVTGMTAPDRFSHHQGLQVKTRPEEHELNGKI